MNSGLRSDNPRQFTLFPNIQIVTLSQISKPMMATHEYDKTDSVKCETLFIPSNATNGKLMEINLGKGQ